MRNPNGYGGITKLSGNRRRPWRVRVTDHWELTDDNKSKQVYKTIGYFATRKEAMLALSAYHEGKEPAASASVPVLFDVYTAWYDSYADNLAPKTAKNYNTAFVHPLQPLANKPINIITLSDYELTMRQSGKTDSTLKLTKIVLQLMYKYAYAHGYVSVDQVSMISYLDIKRIASGSRKENPHKIFTTSEISALWSHKDDFLVQIFLVLIYTGLRSNELLKNPKENWHDTYIDVKHSKTSNGVRQVPICDKIKPIYLALREIKMPSYEKLIKMVDQLPLDTRHTFHDARHTTATLLASALIDERIIKMILGHAGDSVTFNVYTHANFDLMLDALNQI